MQDLELSDRGPSAIQDPRGEGHLPKLVSSLKRQCMQVAATRALARWTAGSNCRALAAYYSIPTQVEDELSGCAIYSQQMHC